MKTNKQYLAIAVAVAVFALCALCGSPVYAQKTIETSGADLYVDTITSATSPTSADGGAWAQRVVIQQIPKESTFISSAAVPFAQTFAPGIRVVITDLRIHASASLAAETFTGTLDSDEGSDYDAVVYTQAMSGLTDKIFTEDVILNDADDEIDFALVNSTTKTISLEIIWRPL